MKVEGCRLGSRGAGVKAQSRMRSRGGTDLVVARGFGALRVAGALGCCDAAEKREQAPALQTLRDKSKVQPAMFRKGLWNES